MGEGLAEPLDLRPRRWPGAGPRVPTRACRGALGGGELELDHVGRGVHLRVRLRPPQRRLDLVSGAEHLVHCDRAGAARAAPRRAGGR